jgi:hypothetical protein
MYKIKVVYSGLKFKGRAVGRREWTNKGRIQDRIADVAGFAVCVS